MPRELGYVSPLLSNLAVDYAKIAREGLIGHRIFPKVLVPKPSGKYAFFDIASSFKVPDSTMSGERARAKEVFTSRKKKAYVVSDNAFKEFIDDADLEFMEGPFKLMEKRKVENLVTDLEMTQEKRIADLFLNLPKRSAEITTKWSNGLGDPVKDIRDAIKQCFLRPNTLVLNGDVFDALEFHPELIKTLGELKLVKTVNEETLSKIFRIKNIIIAEGKADFEKPNEEGSSDPKYIWGDSVTLTYVDHGWDRPCGGKTLVLKYAQADGLGYVVRTWKEEDGGMLGGEYVQVGHSTAEVIVCPELNYTLKEVL
jgi:hypothetical protein